MSSISERLLLTKYFYRKAEAALEESNPYAPGMAVSLCQDAIETLLWTVVREFNLSTKDGVVAIINSLKLFPHQGKQYNIPYVAKILDINKARVGFKHSGVLVTIAQGRRYIADSLDFLIDACSLYFGANFKALSLAELISDQATRNLIVTGEQDFQALKFPEAAINAGRAYAHVEWKLDNFFPRPQNSLSDVARVFEHDKKAGSSGRIQVY